jgi:hypothetical protein
MSDAVCSRDDSFPEFIAVHRAPVRDHKLASPRDTDKKGNRSESRKPMDGWEEESGQPKVVMPSPPLPIRYCGHCCLGLGFFTTK